MEKKNRNLIITSVDGGAAKEISRPDTRPMPNFLMWPTMVIEGMEDLKEQNRLAIFDSVNSYFTNGKAVIPATSSETLLPAIRMVINATEDEIDRKSERSASASRSVNARWGNTDSGPDPIKPFPIGVPSSMRGWTLRRGEVDIPFGEILNFACIFFLRGYPPEELRHFLVYWAKKKWDGGTIADSEGRQNRAQRWRLMDGRKSRFEGDDAALICLTRIMEALPENKRAYLLSENVAIAISTDMRVTLSAPVEISVEITESEEIRCALDEYGRAHGLDKPGHSFIATRFNIPYK